MLAPPSPGASLKRPRRLARGPRRVAWSGSMSPEPSKEERSRSREVQMGLFARPDLDAARLPRPAEAADRPRGDELRARPAPRRTAPGQRLLPFDRPTPPARAPTGEAGPRAGSPPIPVLARPESVPLPAVPPEAVACASVSVQGQGGASPPQVDALRPVTDGNRVAARRGGKQPEVNGQSATKVNSIRPSRSASLQAKGEAQTGASRMPPTLRGSVSKRWEGRGGGWRRNGRTALHVTQRDLRGPDGREPAMQESEEP